MAWLIGHTDRADAAGREVRLLRDGAVYHVPVTLNGWLVRPFIVDTGAGEVQVSTDVLLALFPHGSPPPVYLPGGTYRIADGSVIRNRRFLIPSLRIGDREFRHPRDARDVMLAFLLRTVRHFVGHLKVIRQISGELEKKITVSMENRHLLQMFALSESLVYYMDAIEGNGAVLSKLRNGA